MNRIKAGTKLKQLTLVTLLATSIFGCASDDAIQVAPLPDIKSQFKPKELWKTDIGKGVQHFYSRLAPAYAYDKIFVADRNGEVAALDPLNGKTVWEINLGKEKPIKISGGLTASYEKIFFGTENGELIALDAETGEELWRVNAGGEILAKPLADENVIVVHSSRGDLVAFDESTGNQKWKITTDVPSLNLRGDSAPVSAAGGVFWGMPNGRLGAALLNSGNLIWQQIIAMPKGATEIDRLVDVDANPVISGSTLYTLGFNGQLVAIDLQTGQAIWKRSYSGTNNFVVLGNSIYIVSDQDVIYGIDTRSGTELWKNVDLKYRKLSAPSLINGYLAIGDGEGYLHWLDPQSGDFVAQQNFKGDGIAVPPIQVDSNFLVVTRDGDIYLENVDIQNEEEFISDF